MNGALIAAKAATVALGLVVAGQGFRAARRERSQRLLLTASGFSLLSVGSVLEGVCHEVFELSMLVSGTVQVGFVGAGMVLILLSLFVPGATP